MNELIERLRNRYMDTKKMLPCALEHEAADALERLTAALNKYSEDEVLCAKDADIARLTAELAAMKESRDFWKEQFEEQTK